MEFGYGATIFERLARSSKSRTCHISWVLCMFHSNHCRDHPGFCCGKEFGGQSEPYTGGSFIFGASWFWYLSARVGSNGIMVYMTRLKQPLYQGTVIASPASIVLTVALPISILILKCRNSKSVAFSLKLHIQDKEGIA